MIVLGKYTLAKAVTEARVVVPSAGFMTYFFVAITEAREANPVTCPFYEIIFRKVTFLMVILIKG